MNKSGSAISSLGNAPRRRAFASARLLRIIHVTTAARPKKIHDAEIQVTHQKMPIDSVEFWAGALTAAAVWIGALAAATAVGALIFANKDAKNKTDALSRFQAEATEHAAKLGKEAEEARLEVARLTTPRWEKFNREAFRNELRGKPRMRVELLFPSEDSDSYMLAQAIGRCLVAEGWTTIGPRPIHAEDVLPGADTNAPLSIRMGSGMGGMSYVAKRLARDGNDPINVLLNALNVSRRGLGVTETSMTFGGATDPLLADDLVRLIIGPRYREW